jgi:branched-chain amino acid transport system permease protein
MMLYGLLLMIIIRWEPRGLMAILSRRAKAPARAAGTPAKTAGPAMGGTQ